MSVTMKPASQTLFAGTIPVLRPLYGNGETWQFPADGQWICGRSPECELPVAVEGVAPRHCHFILRAGVLTVQRLEGHIWINDLPVPRQAALRPGDTLSVGPVSFRIEHTQKPVPLAQVSSPPEPQSARNTEPVTVPTARGLVPAPLNSPAPDSEKLATATSEPLTAALLLALQQHQQATVAPVTAPSLIDERLALIQSREKILEQRELHLQELTRFSQERERTLSERAAAQDERLEILNQQKTEVEQNKLSLDSAREEHQKQKEELNRRFQAFTANESKLRRQLEASASAYSMHEQARVELADRELRLQNRERELDVRNRELDARATAAEQEKQATHAQAEANSALLSSLQERELAVQTAEQQLSDREQSASDAEQKLQEANARWNHAQQLEESVQQQVTWLKEQGEQQETLRQQLEALRTELAQQQATLVSQASQNSDRDSELDRRQKEITQKSEELALQAAELDRRQEEITLKSEVLSLQKRELEDSGTRTTRSVEQLAAIAAEREQAARARQEAAAELQQLSQARAAHADELGRLESLSQELAERQARLEAEESRLRDEHVSRETAQSLMTTEASAAEQQSAALEQQRLELQTERDQLAEERLRVESMLSELAGQRSAFEAERTLSAEERAELVSARHQLQDDREKLETELARLSEERATLELAQVALDSRQAVLDMEQAQFAATKIEQEQWETELDSRHAELASRLATLKAARVQNAEMAKANSVAAGASAEELAAIENQRGQLLSREIELAQAESRLDELQKAVSMQLRNAETEREALQSAHKDLICERNSLMQASQDIQSRSANVIERESLVVQQMEELRFRFDALNQQDAELRKLDTELNSRAAELHQRVMEFKQESRTFRAQHVDTVVDGVTQRQSLMNSGPGNSVEEALQIIKAHEAEEKLAEVRQERDALLTAVRELQAAMLNARTDVEDARRIRQEAAQQEQSLAGLYRTLEERSGQLQLMESHLRQAAEQAEALQAQIAELTQRLENSQGKVPHENSQLHSEEAQDAVASSGETDLESSLLLELETMRTELQAARSAQTVNMLQSEGEPDVQTQQLLNQISALQAQLHSVSQTPESDEPVDMIQVDQLRSQIERLEDSLRDRDSLIMELRTRLQKLAQQEALNPPDPAAALNLENVERELDRRVELLDEREDELRERIRKVTQTEEDIESQRRQLLEARQQLEIARSEVQAALKQHSAVSGAEFEERSSDRAHARSSQEVFSSAILEEPALGSSSTLDSSDASGLMHSTDTMEIEDGDASQDLRAELANLFGLKKSPSSEPSAEIRPPSTPSPPASEFFDLSEPTGDASAIELSFSQNMTDIEHPSSFDALDDSSPPREENSDDFVRDYMEQLLARSRKAAGNSLPSELKPVSPPASGPVNVPQPKKTGETKAPPKTKSFIDEYMSGGFKDLDAPPAAPAHTSGADAVTSIPEPAVPRAKVDVQKLRENMNSFRTLSTQSTENALINHAMRTERLSINGRIMLSFVMIFMSVFLAIANTKGIINHPLLIWVTVVGAFASLAELVRKFLSVKSRCKVALSPDHEESARKAGHQSPGTVVLPSIAASASMNSPEPEVVSEEAIRKRQISAELEKMGDGAVGHKESDRTEYFEL